MILIIESISQVGWVLHRTSITMFFL